MSYINFGGPSNLIGGTIDTGGVNIGVSSSGLQALYIGNGYDNVGGNDNGTPFGNVSYGVDSYGKYTLIDGSRNFTLGTGALAGLSIGNRMNFTQATDFSWACTVRIDTLPPNAGTGIFGSGFDSCVYITAPSGATAFYLRGASITFVDLGTYWATRLGETHTFGFTYVASTTRFYCYVDGILVNQGGTLGPATFLTNLWSIGDDAIGGGNSSSARQRFYRGAVWNRTLSDAEHLDFHSAAISRPDPHVARYHFKGDVTDVSGNGYTGTLVGSPTLTTSNTTAANSAYSFNGTSQYITFPANMIPAGSNGYTVWWWMNPTATGNRDRPVTSDNLVTCYYGDTSGGGTTLAWFVGNGTSFSPGTFTTSAITHGSWQMFAITYDGTTGRLYKDGTEIATRAFSSSSVSQPNNFGYGAISTGFDYCAGSFSKFGVVPRALSASEILDIYNVTNATNI